MTKYSAFSYCKLGSRFTDHLARGPGAMIQCTIAYRARTYVLSVLLQSLPAIFLSSEFCNILAKKATGRISTMTIAPLAPPLPPNWNEKRAVAACSTTTLPSLPPSSAKGATGTGCGVRFAVRDCRNAISIHVSNPSRSLPLLLPSGVNY